jgi:hypothetical protein
MWVVRRQDSMTVRLVFTTRGGAVVLDDWARIEEVRKEKRG